MSQQDPATHYILERITDLSQRIEGALRMLETRTEQTAVMREQLKSLQQDVDEIFRILRGDGMDRLGLQHHYHAIVGRLDSMEAALDELDGTARLSRLEATVKQLTSTEKQTTTLLTQEQKGQWALRVESRKGKFLLAAAILTGVLGWGQNIWHFLSSLLK